MADQLTPADVEPEFSSTGIQIATSWRRNHESPTSDVAPATARATPAPGIPPLPASVRDRAKPRTNGDSQEAESSSANPQQELERILRLHREQTAYLAQLETVFAQRSQELLEADEREATLVRRFREQMLRIAELERHVREQNTKIQQLQSALPPRPHHRDSELLQIRGIGPKYAKALDALGFGTIAAVASLSDADVQRIEQQLRIRNGRIQREGWVTQAKSLLS